MGNIIFDGHNFEDYGVVVSGSGTWNMPERLTEKENVYGRHGALITDAGMFDNVEIPYPAWIAREFAERYEDFSRMMALHTDKYYRLEDTYHPDYYRQAKVVPGIIPRPGTLNRSGEFTVAFDCKPQKWLRSGEEVLEITERLELFNMTGFEAKPLIVIPPGAVVRITDEDDNESFLNTANFGINTTYDAETEESVCGRSYVNEYVIQVGSISLKPGRNIITCTAPIKLTPRFFVI